MFSLILGPIAAILGAIAKGAKQMRAGKEVRDNDTAEMNALFLREELDAISTSTDAMVVKVNLQRGINRYGALEQLMQKGVQQ